MKRAILIVAAALLALTAVPRARANGDFEANRPITVVSREDGSGTRSAFIELFGLLATTDDGGKKDMTTKEAIIADKTDIIMANVAGDLYAIGYISLGSLNDTLKALNIDGAEATADNVRIGEYQASRPFIIATKGEAGEAARDFIDFILSAEGQAIIGKSYIEVDAGAEAYAGGGVSGKISVHGSSSVSPIMEKLKEAYVELNPDASIEIQTTDSSAGLAAAIEGACDIGMSSRELKPSEEETLTGITIAIDGIAVVVNLGNPIDGLTKAQVCDIFTGAVEVWSEVAP